MAKFDDYFVDKLDSFGNPGILRLVKTMAAIRTIATSQSRFKCDEFLNLGEYTRNESLGRFSM